MHLSIYTNISDTLELLLTIKSQCCHMADKVAQTPVGLFAKDSLWLDGLTYIGMQRLNTDWWIPEVANWSWIKVDC